MLKLLAPAICDMLKTLKFLTICKKIIISYRATWPGVVGRDGSVDTPFDTLLKLPGAKLTVSLLALILVCLMHFG
jgi:hypothetical protein